MPARRSTPTSTHEADTEDGTVTDIRAAVAAALCKIVEAAPALSKDARNEYARYNYVPIDSYYEVFAKLASSHGLTWVTREVSFSTIEAATDDRGKVRTLACVRYAFDVYLAGTGYIPDFTTFTLLHQITGAQTTGSMVSYAEKVFVRTAMKAVTGEKDADNDAPQEVRTQPIRAGAPASPAASNPARAVLEASAESVSGLVTIDGKQFPEIKSSATGSVAVEIFRAFAPLCTTEDALMEFYSSNKPALERIKAVDPASAQTISSILNARRREILNNA